MVSQQDDLGTGFRSYLTPIRVIDSVVNSINYLFTPSYIYVTS